MKNKKKNIKIGVICGIVLLFIVIIALIYNLLFTSTKNTRLDDISKHKLTKKEISLVKEKIQELENVEDVDVFSNVKIIKIIVKLSEDVDFEAVKEKSNESIPLISEDNLKYYDVEIYYESNNKESEVYPKIGYKHKTQEAFVW